MTSNKANSAGSSPTSTPSSNPPAAPPPWRIEYRGIGGYDTKEASNNAVIADDDLTENFWGSYSHGESHTVQSQAEDADINVLMRRYGITGKMPDPDQLRIPTYGDFTNVTDYRTALEAVQAAHNGFMEIPAELRARFDNDPQKFLEYCADKNNLPEMRKFGLARPEQPAPEPSLDAKSIVDAIKGATPPKPPGGTPSST